MKAPDEVAAMLRLKALGWGVKRIAREFGCSHMTVRRYLDQGGWVEYQTPRRSKALDDLEDWLADRFQQHRGNADVVRQELLAEHGMAVSLRTVERGPIYAASSRPRRGRRCASRRHRGGRCRSTSGNGW